MANISLADKTGTFYNIGTANTEASHVVTGAVAGGMAIMEVNRVGEPTISIAGGVATKVLGVSWEDSALKYLNVYSLDGVNVVYFWSDEVGAIDRTDRVEEDATVTGTKNIDWKSYETFVYTLTGACTFSDTNLPSNGSKTITIHMTGDFAPTYATGWATYISGTYVGTVLNTFVIEYVVATVPFFKVQISQPD